MMKKYGLLAVTSIVLGLAGSIAAAGETSMPGSGCIKWNSGDPEPALSYSEIQNPSSTQWLRVDCPVAKTDFDGFLHDAGIEDSWVRVYDRHPGAAIRCQLVSYYRNTFGGSFWSTGNRYSSTPNVGVVQLNTDALNGENSITHLYYSCHIPPAYAGSRSSIITHYVRQ